MCSLAQLSLFLLLICHTSGSLTATQPFKPAAWRQRLIVDIDMLVSLYYFSTNLMVCFELISFGYQSKKLILPFQSFLRLPKMWVVKNTLGISRPLKEMETCNERYPSSYDLLILEQQSQNVFQLITLFEESYENKSNTLVWNRVNLCSQQKLNKIYWYTYFIISNLHFL